MTEIEFSVMEETDGDTNKLLSLLGAFEKQYRIHVTRTAIGSLVAKQALRPFNPQQVRAPGRADVFLNQPGVQGFWLTTLRSVSRTLEYRLGTII